MNAIVTGAGGFVGRVLATHLDSPRALALGEEDWASRIDAAEFRGAVVYHLAARVHGAASDSEQAFAHDNVTKTEVLARAAASRGARGFVFLSTAKVNGDESGEAPFRATDPPDPRDAYARSKWAAEQALAVIASETGLPVVVVRPPLVYGRGAKANLRLLVRLCDSPWPLPFAALRNRRSFIEVGDLARLLRACEPHARGRTMTFMAAYPQPVSTAEVVAAVRRSLGRPPRLFAASPSVLEAAAALAGQRDAMRRLTRSLVVDATETERLLGWRAQSGLEAAVAELVAGYREEEASH